MDIAVLLYAALMVVFILLSSYDVHKYKWRNRWVAVVLMWAIISFGLVILDLLMGGTRSIRFPREVICGSGAVVILAPFLWRIWRSQKPHIAAHAVLRMLFTILCVLIISAAILFAALS